MATVNRYIDGFNRSDLSAMTAACDPSASLVDDFAPHLWSGTGACAIWFKAFTAWAKANHYADNVVSVGKPWYLMIDGDRAYVVLPAKYTWLQDGKPARMLGSLYTLVLDKSKAGWRIMAWTWADGTGH